MAKEDDGIAGKVAIVTGGGAKEDGVGNGRAACILLARSGVNVVVVDLDEALAEQTVQMIRDEGGEAMAYAADVTVEAACKAVVDAATDAYGGVDLLDNNVGIGSKGSVVDENLEQWDRVMRVNVQSMFLMSKYAIPSMSARGGGAILGFFAAMWISKLDPRIGLVIGCLVQAASGIWMMSFSLDVSFNEVAIASAMQLSLIHI